MDALAATTMRLRVVVLAASALLAACGSAGGTPTSGSPTASASVSPALPTAIASATSSNPAVTPTATAAPGTPAPATPSPTVTPASASAGPQPTLGDGVDLASLLPTEIAGNAMTIEPASDPGRSFLILWNDENIARRLLESLGATAADVSIVYSYPTKNTYPKVLKVDAYRVAGVDGTALAQGMANTYLAFFEANGYPPAEVVPMTVDGKSVLIFRSKGDPPNVGVYYYPVGEVVFSIQTDPTEWTNEALALLP